MSTPAKMWKSEMSEMQEWTPCPCCKQQLTGPTARIVGILDLGIPTQFDVEQLAEALVQVQSESYPNYTIDVEDFGLAFERVVGADPAAFVAAVWHWLEHQLPR